MPSSEKEINNQKNKLERIKKAYINGDFELKEYNEEKKIVENAITELENKLDTTDCVEELKFTPRDILLKRDIELDIIGTVIAVKQINFRESICKPCQELFDKGYIDTTKPMILANVLGSFRFSNYLPEEEVGEIIMRLQQYYDVHFTETTYYVQKQVKIYVANNAKIKDLREEKIELAKIRWILYFGR